MPLNSCHAHGFSHCPSVAVIRRVIWHLEMYDTLTCMFFVIPFCVYRFHWVIILAGVNDIGWGASAEEIFHGLRRMYHVSMSV